MFSLLRLDPPKSDRLPGCISLPPIFATDTPCGMELSQNTRPGEPRGCPGWGGDQKSRLSPGFITIRLVLCSPNAACNCSGVPFSSGKVP